jgi:hypothetical protein
MAYFKRGGFKKKSGFVRIGGMFKSDKEYLPENAAFSYNTTCNGKYLEPVVEFINKVYDQGGSVKFSLTKWNDQEQPVLSVSEAKSKPSAAGPAGGKRIGREEPREQVTAQDVGL